MRIEHGIFGYPNPDEKIKTAPLRLALSRRNLEVLLAKLNGNPPQSACTIVGGTEAMLQSITGEWFPLIIRAEEDDVHYRQREPGIMHPDTEEAIQEGV